MPTLTLRGDQIGQALQFVENAGTTTVEIGRVWFAATDTVRLEIAPGLTDANGAFLGGNGAILSMTVTTASGQVTTFSTSSDGLDVDPDQSKIGADFFYISESPGRGTGGAYDGLVLEQIVVSDVALAPNALVTFAAGGGYLAGTGGGTGGGGGGTGTGTGGGTPDNDTLNGTKGADTLDGGAGNDTIYGKNGNDSLKGGDGNDRIDAGGGADRGAGGDGDDRMLGQGGADQLAGDAGNDLLDGGAGKDKLTGGLGGDDFVFGAGDQVLDFSAAEGDQIVFNAALGLTEADVTITQNSKGTVIAVGAETMLLKGYFGPIDPGNDITFDYVPSFDFL